MVASSGGHDALEASISEGSVLAPDKNQSSSSSTAGAFARSLSASFAFMFKRPPLRFFRPTKISTYTALQVLAEERNKPLSTRFVRSIIRSEGGPLKFTVNHVLPPFVANTVVGLTLFGAYTSTETALLLPNSSCPTVLVPAVAGAVAGAAQSLVSAPLDNVRQLLLHRRAQQGKTHFKGWVPLMKEALLPPFVSAAASDASKLSGAARVRLWASRGWSLTTLSLMKDSLGFSAFFAIFSLGRSLARDAAWLVDDAFRRVYPGWDREDEARSWTGRIIQSLCIVFSGATAGWAYGIVSEPFEVMRRTIWDTRMQWWATLQKSRSPRSRPSFQTTSAHCKQRLLSATCRRWRIIAESPKNPTLSSELPSAWSILRWRAQQDGGVSRWLLSGFRDPEPLKKPNKTPLSFGGLGKGAARHIPLRTSTVARFRSFLLTPYAVGFFVYAVASGDLQIN